MYQAYITFSVLSLLPLVQSFLSPFCIFFYLCFFFSFIKLHIQLFSPFLPFLFFIIYRVRILIIYLCKLILFSLLQYYFIIYPLANMTLSSAFYFPLRCALLALLSFFSISTVNLTPLKKENKPFFFCNLFIILFTA